MSRLARAGAVLTAVVIAGAGAVTQAGGAPAARSAAGADPATGTRGSLAAARCNGERWNVRNLLDRAAADVSLRPRATTVPALLALRPTRRVTASTPRLRQVEYRTYRLRVPLVAGRRLPNRDIVLVLGVPPATIHVVFPDTHACENIVEGDQGQEIHVASDEVENLCGVMPIGRWQRLRGRADVTGVGFFAVRHPQALAGAAPSGLELHPALGFASSNCRGVAGGFPAAG